MTKESDKVRNKNHDFGLVTITITKLCALVYKILNQKYLGVFFSNIVF